MSLGFAHPDHMLARLSSRQIADWIAYYRLEPFGEQANDMRHAVRTAAMLNRWRGKHERTYHPKEFRLTQEVSPEEEEPETLFDKIKAVFAPLRK